MSIVSNFNIKEGWENYQIKRALTIFIKRTNLVNDYPDLYDIIMNIFDKNETESKDDVEFLEELYDNIISHFKENNISYQKNNNRRKYYFKISQFEKHIIKPIWKNAYDNSDYEQEIKIRNMIEFGNPYEILHNSINNNLNLEVKFSRFIKILNKNEIPHLKETDYCITEQSSLAYDDSSIDLVIFNMTLHTMKNPENILKEVYRIMAPGGKLIIREHNCIMGNSFLSKNLKDFYLFLDIIRSLYSCVLTIPREKSPSKYMDSFNGNYNDSRGWEYIITNIGFSPLMMTTQDSNYRKNKRIYTMESYLQSFVKY